MGGFAWEGVHGRVCMGGCVHLCVFMHVHVIVSRYSSSYRSRLSHTCNTVKIASVLALTSKKKLRGRLRFCLNTCRKFTSFLVVFFIFLNRNAYRNYLPILQGPLFEDA